MALAKCLPMSHGGHSDLASQLCIPLDAQVFCVRWDSSSGICYSMATAHSWQQEGVPIGTGRVGTSLPVSWRIL